MTYAPNTPEYRVAELARQESGLPDDEVLRRVGYVPHDGTLQRGDLLAQYRTEADAADRTAKGIGDISANWAYAEERAGADVADAYGDHMAAGWRAGDVTEHTTHAAAFPRFYAGHCRDALAATARPGDEAHAATQRRAFDVAQEFGWLRGMSPAGAADITSHLTDAYEAAGARGDIKDFARRWDGPAPDVEAGH